MKNENFYFKKKTILQTAQELQQRLLLTDHLDRQTLHAYDTIWVIALLIRASIGKE